MTTDSEMMKDPVCDMQVAPQQNAITYQGMHFAFCSLQCKERFLANPHLYIGSAAEQAPRQQGQQLFKRRHLRLDKPLTPSAAQQVGEALLAMMGVHAVDVAGEELTITYDLLQVSAEQIEGTLQEIGVELGGGMGEQLRRAFIHYREEAEVENLEVRPGFHGYGGRHP
ncbi:MAG TPA: YHS domain-containing protein [Gammaproteobacteria bacterium]